MSAGRLHPSSPGFLRLYGLAFLFFSANSVLTVMLPLLSSQEGFGEAEIGLMMGSYMLTCMLLRPLAGQLIGRHGPLAVMRWLLAAHAVSLALYAVAGAEQFTGLRIVQGAVTAFFSMTMQTGIVEGLEERDRAQGLSLYTLSTMVPSLIGPIVAVELWQNGDRLLLAAVLLALALLPLLLGLGAPLARRGAADRSYTLLDLGRSLRQVRGSRPLQASMAVMLCASFGFGATATFLPLSMMKDGSGHAGLYLMLQGRSSSLAASCCASAFRPTEAGAGRSSRGSCCARPQASRCWRCPARSAAGSMSPPCSAGWPWPSCTQRSSPISRSRCPVRPSTCFWACSSAPTTSASRSAASGWDGSCRLLPTRRCMRHAR